MRYFEWFAGIRGFGIGLDRAGHTCVGSCEVADFPRRVHAARFGQEPLFGDIHHVRAKKIPAADLWCGGFPCFPPDTLITTSLGEKRIADVVAGDRVLTHTGRFRRVLAVGARPFDGSLVGVRATGMPEVLATPNHPFLSRGPDSFVPYWARADELVPRSWLQLVAPNEGGDGAMPGYLIPDHDPRLWWIVGFWLAEGWRTMGARARRGTVGAGVGGSRNALGERSSWRVSFSCNAGEVDEAVRRIGERFHVTRSDERTAIRLIVTDEALWTLLGHFGSGAAGKFIPPWVYDLPYKCRRELLSGYLAGDGCVRGRGWQATTVSPSLARGVQMLALTVYGHMPLLYISHPARTCVIEGRTVQAKQTYLLRQQVAGEGGGWAQWSRVRKVRQVLYTGLVYNMEVEGDHSYVAQGFAVHNCQDISSAGRREGLDGSRSGLIWTLLDLWDQCPKVEWLLLENVRNLLSGRDEDDEDGEPEGDPAGGLVGLPAGDVAWMGVLLVALAERGLRFAYRVLDAQFFGVPQRRRRVFILARRARDGVHPGEVLLEPAGVRRGHRAGRAKGAEAAAAPEGGSLFCGALRSTDGGSDVDHARAGHLVVAPLTSGPSRGDAIGNESQLVPVVARTVRGSAAAAASNREADSTLIVVPDLAATRTSGGTPSGSPAGRRTEDIDNLVVCAAVAPPLSTGTSPSGGGRRPGTCADDAEGLVASTVTASAGHHRYSSPRGHASDNLIPVKSAVVPFDMAQITHPENRARCDDGAPALAATGQASVAYNVHSAHSNAKQDHAVETDVARSLDQDGGLAANQGGTVVAVAYAFQPSDKVAGPGALTVRQVDVAPTVAATDGEGKTDRGLRVAEPGPTGWRVRRLTPLECERLQGFPDGFTCLCGVTPYRTALCKCPDGPRYAALGNAVATVVSAWLGHRLAHIAGRTS